MTTGKSAEVAKCNYDITTVSARFSTLATGDLGHRTYVCVQKSSGKNYLSVWISFYFYINDTTAQSPASEYFNSNRDLCQEGFGFVTGPPPSPPQAVSVP